MLRPAQEVPYLHVTSPGFSITSGQVHAARERSWYARTPYGIAMLRYDDVKALIFGGYDTTRSQLSLAMATFAAHPGQWRLLAERPELGAAAVEEVMRVNPTIRWVTRETLEELEHNGTAIPAGTTIHLFTESAGTDPRAYGPAAFDITAQRPPHFGFGGGAHHCLGHFVARSDMSEALPLLARRLREPRLEPGAVWAPDSGNTGASRL